MKHSNKLTSRLKYIILFLFVLQCTMWNDAWSQAGKESPFTSRLNVSYQLGGQFYNDHFIYNPGFSIQYTQSYKLTKSLEAGIGTGYYHLLDESFVPFYLEFLGYKKHRNNSPLIRFQLGGTTAWYRSNNYPSDYSLSGRVFFSAGMGRRIQINERYSALFQWSLCHISAIVGYQIFDDMDYSSLASYDMLQLSFGIMRN